MKFNTKISVLQVVKIIKIDKVIRLKDFETYNMI